MVNCDAALPGLLERLKHANYRFTAVTPATHSRVLARAQPGPLGLRDIFGWNRPFARCDVDPDIIGCLEDAGALIAEGPGFRSGVRVASLADDLFLHSAFPTDSEEAVFFGPDTYRFARFVAQHLRTMTPPRRIVDMGAGSGAGGIACARVIPDATIALVDINPVALRLAAINAAAAGVGVELCESGRIPASADLVIANPPYMIDRASRTYRDGGGLLGGDVALDWTKQAIAGLGPGGQFLLYTGAPFVRGWSPLVDSIRTECDGCGASFDCTEIDPDVFGEELDDPDYAEVERIAALGFRISRPR
jgi:hypothetical protein